MRPLNLVSKFGRLYNFLVMNVAIRMGATGQILWKIVGWQPECSLCLFRTQDSTKPMPIFGSKKRRRQTIKHSHNFCRGGVLPEPANFLTKLALTINARIDVCYLVLCHCGFGKRPIVGICKDCTIF